MQDSAKHNNIEAQEEIPSELHFMYVLKCADNTLYTGYTNDVEARVAAHNAGKGAKYTRTRGPVEVIAQAQFDSKTEAMSAEYHFKKLSRPTKEALIAQAKAEPFQNVLRQNLKLKTSKVSTGDSSENTVNEEIESLNAACNNGKRYQRNPES